MDFEENMVENGEEQTEDSLPEGLAEEPEESGESLDSITEGEDEPAEEDNSGEQRGTTEPGYVKRRIEKAVQKAVAETEARMREMFEQQMAPLRAKMIEDEAQELVRTRKVADIETARELVRFRQGQAQEAPQQAEQPRNPNGQFAPKDDPAISARIDMLKHQREVIQDEMGIDPAEGFDADDEIKDKVINGEMDFYDVAKHMQRQKKKRPPSPMRSPNGATGTSANAIDSMSDAQFAKLEKRISEGARFTLR